MSSHGGGDGDGGAPPTTKPTYLTRGRANYTTF